MMIAISETKALNIISMLVLKKHTLEIENNKRVTAEQLEPYLKIRFELDQKYDRLLREIDDISHMHENVALLNKIISEVARAAYIRSGIILLQCGTWSYREIDLGLGDNFIEELDYFYRKDNITFCFKDEHMFSKKNVLARIDDDQNKSLIFDQIIAPIPSYKLARWYINKVFNQPSFISTKDIELLIERMKKAVSFSTSHILLTEKEVEEIEQYR